MTLKGLLEPKLFYDYMRNIDSPTYMRSAHIRAAEKYQKENVRHISFKYQQIRISKRLIGRCIFKTPSKNINVNIHKQEKKITN